MSILELGKRILDKRFDALAQRHAQPLKPQDGNLPMSAHVGSLIDIAGTPFALLEGSLVTGPAEAQCAIESIGRIRMSDLDSAPDIFNYYTGIEANGCPPSFLQVVCEDKEVTDLAFYQFHSREVPTTPEEQAVYLGNGFGLGEFNYHMGEDKLLAAGLRFAQVSALLAGQESLVFERDAAGGDYIAPFVGTEVRIDDAYGEKGLRRKVWFMPYTRMLSGDTPERLLIMFSAVESVNGRPQQRVFVDSYVGIGLEPRHVKIV